MSALSKIVIVADKQTLLRAAVCEAIKEFEPLTRFTEASTFADAIMLASSWKYDLVICDISLDSNIDVIYRLRETAPSIIIFIYSSFDERLFALPSLQAGADGYLGRSADKGELGKAFKALVNGKKYLSQAVQQMVLNQTLKNRHALGILSALTKKEFEVMQLLANYHSVQEIARILNLKHNTVGIHKRNIYKKLGVRTDADLFNRL